MKEDCRAKTRPNADDAQMLLLEIQPAITAASRTQPDAALRQAAAAAWNLAAVLGIPILASTVPIGGAVPALVDGLRPLEPHMRSAVGLFDDGQARSRIAANGRSVLAIGGVSSEIAVLHAVLGARRAGYDVHVPVTAAAG